MLVGRSVAEWQTQENVARWIRIIMNIDIKLLYTAPSSTRKRRETYASSINVQPPVSSLQAAAERTAQSTELERRA